MRSLFFSTLVSMASLGMVVSTAGFGASCTSVPGNLIANCGFENGSLSGWTLTGNTTNPPGGFNGSGYGLDAPDANSGSYGLYIGPIGSTMSLSQNITVAANTQYSITFSVNPNTKPYINSNHTFNVEIDNTTLTTTLAPILFLGNPTTVGAYVQYTYTFTLTSAQLGGSTGPVALLFTFRNDDDYWSFDDVSVTPAGLTISKAFSPATIQSGGTSVVTLMLTNNNTFAATGGTFTDTLANMSAAGGAVTGSCIGTSPATLTSGQTSLSFSGINIPATSSCTVIFSVTSSTPGVQPNTTSGVTITQTGNAGPSSNTANLTVVGPPTISKSFNPSSIQSGSTSVVTLTLANGNGIALTGGAFTDTLANMSAAGGAVTGTCAGTSPSTLTVGQTALGFTGITIPASSSCTVIFNVTSATPGIQPNKTSGATTTQTPIVGTASNTANLTVIAPPTIQKAFNPSTIQLGSNSVVTLTLANSNASDLTGVAFNDALVNMSAAGGTVTGTCVGTTPATLTAGQTALSYSGITVPASNSCTVIFTVTSNTQGVQNNTTSGATTAQTPIAGPTSNTAILTVLMGPTISKAFNPTSIQSGGSSIVTLTLSNSNSTDLTGAAFSDTLVNMTAVGGAVTGSCVGTLPGTLTSGQTVISFNGISLPASSSCTVSFSVTSITQGVQNNTTSGVFTNQTTTAGAASNTATLTVFAPPTVTKSFNPTVIPVGGSSVVTVSISNSNGATLNGGSFLDTLVNMSAVGGAVTGSCVGTSPNTLTAGQTVLTFIGINIPASGCNVKFSVTSSTLGLQSNTTSGVTSVQTPNPGSGSNTATLTVLSTPTIAKAFSPTEILSGGASTVTLTLSNTTTATLLSGAFTDTLVNMSAAGGSVTGTCAGTTPTSLTAGQTALSFSGITIPPTGSCTVIFSVTSSTLGVQSNTTSGVTTSQTPTAGTPSNTANLNVLSAPTIAKAFSPTTIQSGGSSTVTLTLTNGNASALTGGAFTDTLVNMTAVGGNVTGTCAGTTPTSLAAGQTALSFTGITLPASGSCTVIFSVTSSVPGVQSNTTSGVTTTQTPTAGSASSAALLTVLSAPSIAKAFNPNSIASGGNSLVTLTVSNSNASALTGGAFTDTLVNMTAVGGVAGGSCAAGTSFSSGQTALNFTGINIPAGGCTITFSVTSSNVGANNNTTSGVTTAQTPTAGSASNTATLTVTALALPTIAKAFSPTSIQAGGTSTVTLRLANSTASALTGGSLTDTLVNMSAVGGVVGGSCAAGTSLSAGQTALSFFGITIPANGNCTITFAVTSNTIGVLPNTTSGVTTPQTTIGTGSNTALLTVLAAPGITKGFNPTSIAPGNSSTVTLTLSNSNASALTGGAFTDTLVNMTAVGGVVGGSCAAGTSFSSGQTALNFTGINIPAGGCTITFSVTSSHAGSNPNTTSGVTTTQTPIAGSGSNTAMLTVTSQTAAVTGVTSSTANGSYKAGAVISIQVSFSAPVTVTGTPILTLNSGGVADYASGSGTSTLTFAYTVAPAQGSAHLDYTSMSALALNGGTITDASSNAALLALPAPGAAGSLGANTNIAIDTTAPTVISYSVLFGGKSFNMAGSTRNRLPWQITGIQVVFSEPVTATAAGLSGLNTTGVSGSGTNTVTWNLSPISNLPNTLTKILGTTATAVTDIAGNPLGGGADFSQALKVLYGDFNDDGVVNAQDLVLVNGARSQTYNIFADLNGDSAVDANDVLVVRALTGNSNP